MSATAISIEGLGKKYQIRHQLRNTNPTFKDVLTSAGAALVRRVRGRQGEMSPLPAVEEFWALKDISLQLGEGERLGIIGRNGAGKSTLLKILCRITEPTTGSVRLRGRVGSLLEVGTGFHPELTGRENILLNGAILGMSRAEILRKFDDIVQFSGVEKFLDTPVKRYSSGMYVRLAFAVAAHLEPEILIVDEVLAVGDEEFQRKCIGKMQDVSRSEGRTVLFVSHNMDAIRRLCSQCVLLEEGRLAARGGPEEIVTRYLSAHADGAVTQPNTSIDLTRVRTLGTGLARIVALQYCSDDASSGYRAYPNGPLEFTLSIHSDAPRLLSSLAVTLYSNEGVKLVNADTISLGKRIALGEGRTTVRLRIAALHLNPGEYVLGLWMAEERTARPLDYVENALTLDVFERHAAGRGSRANFDGTVTCPFEIVEVR